jgi:hypothetical protein
VGHVEVALQRWEKSGAEKRRARHHRLSPC